MDCKKWQLTSDQIKLKFTGHDKLKIDKAGNLDVGLRFTDVKFNIPESYQVTPEGKKLVSFEFKKKSDNTVGFECDQKLNPKSPMVIDPFRTWGTYMDGWTTQSPAFDEYLYAIQLDSTDMTLYCAGSTNWNLPTNTGNYTADGYLNTITDLNGGQIINPFAATVVYRINFNGNDFMDLTCLTR
ncbi:MAG: hypothetical protein IPM92_05400 [Saprospiraceae bacterium]|nr:hypothetical protein [Saprospiraceae bacterium]